MNYLENLMYSEFAQLIDDFSNWEFLVKFDSTLSINYGVDENGFYTCPNNTARPIDKSLRKYQSSDWKMRNPFQNNCAIFAHEVYSKRNVQTSNKLNILFDKIPNYIPYNSIVDCTIFDFALDPVYSSSIKSDISKIDVPQSYIDGNEIKTCTKTIEYQILPPIKVDIKISNYLLTKFTKKNWTEVMNELKHICIDQANKIRTNIIDPVDGYLHDGIIIKSNNNLIIIQNDYQYNLVLSRDWEPLNKLNTITQNFERNRLTQEKAISEIDDMNNNFKEYFPRISPTIYPKIIQQFEYTKIKIQQR